MKRSLSVAALAVLVVMTLLTTSLGTSSNGNGLTNVVGSGSFPANPGLPQSNVLFDNFTQELMVSGSISSLAIGDLNNDSRPDIAVGYSDRNGIDVFYQSVLGYFSSVPSKSIPTSNHILALTICDYIGDGKNALVVGNGSKLNGYLQTEGFAQSHVLSSLISTYKIHGLVARDFDLDGKVDFAVLASTDLTGSESALLSIRYNDGASSFTPKDIYISNMTRPRSIAVGDFDNNGLDDIAIADAGKNIVAGFVNTNDPIKDWNSTYQISVGLSKPSDVFINNTNGLGNKLVVACTSGIRLYNYVSSTKTFGLNASISMAGVNKIAPIDFDKNARLDIAAVSNSTNNASIFLSPATNKQYGFPITAFPCLDNPVFMKSADFNNDTKQDLLIASGGKAGTSAIVIYFRTNTTMSNANDNIILDSKNSDSVTIGRFNGTAFSTVASLNRSSHVITFTDRNMDLVGSITMAHTLLSIATDDLNNDGFDDIVTLDQNGLGVTLYWGNANFFSGTNPTTALSTKVSSPISVEIGNLTGDSGKEIVVGLSNGFEIFKNNGTTPFSSNYNFTMKLPSTIISAMALGDFDVGYETTHGYYATNDIALVNSSNNQVQIYFNTRDGITPFKSGFNILHWNTTIDLSHYSKILWLSSGDVNGDGLKDLVVGLSDGKILVFVQNRLYPNGFDGAAPIILQTSYGSDHGTTSDINDDGISEIISSSNRSGQVTAFKDTGTSLQSIANWTVGAGNILPLCGDLNGDKRTDLIAAATRSSSISAYYQNNLRPGAKMSPPLPSSPFEGDTTKFNASASTDGISDIGTLNYTWIFDNQTTQWGWMVNHTFISHGMHAFTLIVKDRDGLSDRIYGTIVVQDRFPTASFTFTPSSPKEWEQITFTDTSSSPTNTINSWYWDFGDGTTSNARNPPVHIYDFKHTYQVKLRVTETDGSVNETVKTVNVGINMPLVDFVTSTLPTEGFNVTFTDMSNASRDTILWREWDFGDGTAKVNTSSVTTVHKYSYKGSYFVTLRIQDNESAISSTIKEVGIADQPPVVSFSENTKIVSENGTVRFTDTSTTYTLNHIENWYWSFGDGASSQERNPDHTYLLHGTFNVVLEVICNDSTNWSHSEPTTITVTDIAPASIFDVAPGPWYEGNNSIQFTDRSTFYWLDPITWLWNFGDGSVSTEKNPIHSYIWAGTYHVTLTVKDLDSVTSVSYSNVIIHNAIPTVAISVITPKPYVVGDSITFQDASTATPDRIIAWLWESDGMTSTQSTFAHRFYANSTFTVKLTVWTNDTVQNSTVISIDFDPSNVYITFDRTINYTEDSSVTFICSAIRSPTDPIVNYTWDMSFGSVFIPQIIRTENSITWHFNQSGSYLIKVRVYDTYGYTENSTQITILESDPVPAFSYGNLNSPGPVWFNANQTRDTPSDEPLLKFRWNFGDNSPWTDWSSNTTISHIYPGDANYTVIMQVKDDSGKIISLTHYVVVDRSPPTIEIPSPVSKAYFGDPIFVYAKVYDTIGVQNVTLVYTIGNQTFRKNMTPTGQADIYVGEIPAQNRSVNLSYAITAVDVSGIQSSLSQSFQIVLSQRPANDLLWAVVALALIVIAGLLAYAFATKPVVDEVFVIYQDGSLLSHDTRHLKPGMDDQILGSMLIALQSFVKDSFKDESMTELKRMEFGEKRILVERQGPIFLAVILRGKRDGKASNRMKSSLEEINQRFGVALNPWDGDLEKVRGVKDSVKPLVKRKNPFGKK